MTWGHLSPKLYFPVIMMVLLGVLLISSIYKSWTPANPHKHWRAQENVLIYIYFKYMYIYRGVYILVYLN